MIASALPRLTKYWQSATWAGLVGLLAVSTSYAQEPDNPQALRDRALTLVNQSRSEHDLSPLSLGESLDATAQNHADDMFERNYYAHSSPEGDTVQDRFIAAGGSRWELVAENIARCVQCTDAPDIAEVERLHEGWMNSPEHRANILAEGLSRFGYGIVTDADQGLYAVQTFAGPGTPRGYEAGQDLQRVETGDMAAILVDAVNMARDQSGLAPIEASDSLNAAAATLLPENVSNFSIDATGNVFDALDGAEQSEWSRLLTLAGECGGCGTEPTRTDIEDFAQQWLDQPSYSQSLLDPQIDAAGFILRADGAGRKIALLVVGTNR